MLKNARLGRPLLFAVMIAVSSVSVSRAANDPARLPTDPKIGLSQTQMACKVWFTKSLPGFFMRRVIDLTYWPRGALSKERHLRAQFEKNPALWDELNVTRGNRYYNYDNQLKIYNTEDDMAHVAKKTLGFCWGHATMKFYFTRMSFFDPQGLHSAIPVFKEGSKEWVDFYQAIIKKIANGEPAVIPGFATLREFSEHPALINWFRYHAAIEWAERMASIFNAKAFLSKRDYTSAEGMEFISGLQKRLANGYNPKIIFDENSHKLVEGEQNSLHVVQVVGVHKLKNDKWAIEVVDDKFGVKKSQRNRRRADGQDETEILYMSLKAGKDKKSALAVYIPWRKIDTNKPFGAGNAWDMGGGIVNQFRIAPENDIEAMEMVLALKTFCKKKPKVCKDLGNRDKAVRERPPLEDAGGRFKPFEYADE